MDQTNAGRDAARWRRMALGEAADGGTSDLPPAHVVRVAALSELPKRLTVPRPLVAQARTLTAPDGRGAGSSSRELPGQHWFQLDAPRWQTPDWDTVPAATRDIAIEMSGVDGSVDLTGRPWNDVPPPPIDGADGPKAVVREPGGRGKPEVPLWLRLTTLLQPPVALLLAPDGPLEWPAPLFPYQLEGVAALTSRETLLLADDMGLGKTIQAIAALRILALQRQVERCLLVAPASLLGQWRRALRQWAPELHVTTIHGTPAERVWQWHAPAHVFLTGYETLRSDFSSNPQAPARRHLWDLVILDEAQRIKNRESEISRKCKQLPRRRAWALSGTPVENSLDDLASVLEFVNPHGDGGPGVALSRYNLREKLRTLQLRRRKVDVLPQLPPKIVTQVGLPLSGAQQESYARTERQGVLELRERGENVRIDNVLDLIVKLKQICNFCPATGQSAKFDDLARRVETLSLEGHRALVFTQFTDERFGARALARRLSVHGALLYTGDLTVAQREAVLQRFKADPSHKVLVISLRAGGYGLNLQEASYVFHFDRWWNPAVERQAEDRSHRLGQTMPVNVYAYTLEGTIEERIDTVLRQKQRLFDEVIDDVSIDLSTSLDRDELLGLFGLGMLPQTT